MLIDCKNIKCKIFESNIDLILCSYAPMEYSDTYFLQSQAQEINFDVV